MGIVSIRPRDFNRRTRSRPYRMRFNADGYWFALDPDGEHVWIGAPSRDSLKVPRKALLRLVDWYNRKQSATSRDRPEYK